LFESKYANHCIVRRHKLESPLPTGGFHTTQQTLTYQFQAVPSNKTESGWVGVLRVKEGTDKLSTDPEAFLREGEEFGIERDAVQALMASRSFGEDFWLAGHDPGTLYPRPQDWGQDVRRASVALDEEKLLAMIAEERKTHNRGELISDAEDALALVREALAAMQAQADEAAKAKPAAKQKAGTPA
jgi:hypothetical protein